LDTWWHGVAEDFATLPNVAEALRIVVRLSLAALLGGVLGYDRQRLGKSAGLRTHMLVALGAAFIVLVPERYGMTSADLSRVIQGLITGIGFIGGGAILKESDRHQVKGLTTAAGLWFTSAIGMAAGLGREMAAIVGATLAFVVLALWRGVEERLCPAPADSPEGHKRQDSPAAVRQTEHHGPERVVV
jgi:putative Mg2+ transporter-C (MgtC) family protein